MHRQSAAAVVGNLQWQRIGRICPSIFRRPAPIPPPRADAPDGIARVQQQQRHERAEQRAALRAHRAARGRRGHRRRMPPLFIFFVFSARGSHTPQQKSSGAKHCSGLVQCITSKQRAHAFHLQFFMFQCLPPPDIYAATRVRAI